MLDRGVDFYSEFDEEEAEPAEKPEIVVSAPEVVAQLVSL